MKYSNQNGFTIIETILFLAITGLLVAAILIGSGNSINTQRYRDSVSSLQSILQQQYSDVTNVNHDQATQIDCEGYYFNRGQSDCVLLGRLITTTDGKTINIQKVAGCDSSVTEATPLLNDVDVFRTEAGGYDTYVSSVMKETYDLEWGSALVNDDGSPMQFSILILLSPNSGMVRTFIDPDNVVYSPSSVGSSTVVQSMITEDALVYQSLTMCVSSNGLFTGPKSAVRIGANSTGSSGIETLGGGDASNDCN